VALLPATLAVTPVPDVECSTAVLALARDIDGESREALARMAGAASRADQANLVRQHQKSAAFKSLLADIAAVDASSSSLADKRVERMRLAATHAAAHVVANDRLKHAVHRFWKSSAGKRSPVDGG
jgi:hypothetical protein